MKATERKKVNRTLREVFGLERLRPGQREIIEHVLRGEDVLAILPTGAGKSLCYQLPALQLEGMTVVVSPLISLMKDQTDKLSEIGLDAANLNSAVAASEQEASLEDVERERSDFIFTTPERLADEDFLATLADKTIDFVVIDEAHCISSWGHDFRPAYLALREAFQQLGDPPVLALTATATPEVIEDIRRQLDRPRMQVVRGGIYRPNLRFEVFRTTNDAEKRERLTGVLSETEGSKIVYCATVKAVEEVTETLRSAGFDAESYHGKLSAKNRTDVQNRFMAGELATIVATNAFGMGVDKPDIRAVLHWQIPGSLEAYYQEAGRAGRNGEPARCCLLYDTRDRRVQQYFLGGRYPSADDVLTVFQTLESLRAGHQKQPKFDEIRETLGDALGENKLRVALNLLKDEKILRERRGSRFELVKPETTGEEIKRLAETYVERNESDREKLQQMMSYAGSASCRWQFLVKYFESDEEIERCGTCDNCVSPPEEHLDVPVPADQSSPAEQEKLLADLRRENEEAEVAVGETVEVPKFRQAKVKSVTGDKIEVVLDGGERKTFKRDFVRKLT